MSSRRREASRALLAVQEAVSPTGLLIHCIQLTKRRPDDLPVFKDSSSPELDTLLSTVRSKIFVPGYLNPAQKKLVIKEKFASQLEHDPTYATIGNEEVRLEHIDVKKDVPNHWQAFNQAIELAKTPQDWVNLIGVVEGFNNVHKSSARRGLRSGWKQKFVRKACEAGRIGIVIQALKAVERNGLSLRDEGVRHQLFKALRQNAKQADWSEPALKKSLDYAEEAINMMELPGHCGSRIVAGNDGRADPVVLGACLELSVRQAALSKDLTNESVRKFATRLASVIQHAETDLVSSCTPSNCVFLKRLY
jgi:hypothetical protein